MQILQRSCFYKVTTDSHFTCKYGINIEAFNGKKKQKNILRVSERVEDGHEKLNYIVCCQKKNCLALSVEHDLQYH